MTVCTAFQFHDNTFLLTCFLRNHGEGFGDFPYFHFVYHFGDFGRQLLHLEFGSVGIGIRQQTMIVARILVLRKYRCRFLKREFSVTDIIGDGIQTRHA